MIFKTHVFSLNSHLHIYVSINIQYIRTGWRWWRRAIRCAPEDDDVVNSEIHLDAVFDRVRRCTMSPRWSELRDEYGRQNRFTLQALSLWEIGGSYRASLEMHFKDAIEPVWRCTSRPWTYGISGLLGGGRWDEGVGRCVTVKGSRYGSWHSTHQLVGPQPGESGRGIFTFELWRRAGWSCREARRKLRLHSGVTL